MDESEAAAAALASLIRDLETGEVRSGRSLAARLDRFVARPDAELSSAEVRAMHEDAAALIDGYQRTVGNAPATEETRQKMLVKLQKVAAGGQSAPEPQKPKNRGGRPPKYDWDSIWHEIVRIANTPDGLPDRAELQRQILSWCGEHWHDPPAESVVREKLSALYADIVRQ